MWSLQRLADPSSRLIRARRGGDVITSPGQGFAAPAAIPCGSIGPPHSAWRRSAAAGGLVVLGAQWVRARNTGHRRRPLEVRMYRRGRRRLPPRCAYPFLDEKCQPLGQNRFGDIEVDLEVGEPSDAVERVAHDEQRPAFTNDLQRPGDRAVLVGVVTR